MSVYYAPHYYYVVSIPKDPKKRHTVRFATKDGKATKWGLIKLNAIRFMHYTKAFSCLSAMQRLNKERGILDGFYYTLWKYMEVRP